LPILIIQARFVRKTALKLPEAIGPREGQAGAGPRLSSLIIGDSAAAGVGVETQCEALSGTLVNNLSKDFLINWQLVAKTGNNTEATLEQVKRQVVLENIDLVITSLGINDVTGGKSRRHWLEKQKALHDYCFNNLAAKHIAVSGLPPLAKFPLVPQPLRWVLGQRAIDFDKQQIKQIESNENITHIPVNVPFTLDSMARDGFHPGLHAYQTWGTALAEFIRTHQISIYHSTNK
jgi:lysophospholipase L1-like esterase